MHLTATQISIVELADRGMNVEQVSFTLKVPPASVRCCLSP